MMSRFDVSVEIVRERTQMVAFDIAGMFASIVPLECFMFFCSEAITWIPRASETSAWKIIFLNASSFNCQASATNDTAVELSPEKQAKSFYWRMVEIEIHLESRRQIKIEAVPTYRDTLVAKTKLIGASADLGTTPVTKVQKRLDNEETLLRRTTMRAS